MPTSPNEFESRRGSIEKGRKMPETRPASVSRLALAQTVTQIAVEEEGRMVRRSVKYSTLPSSATLIIEGADVSVFSRAEDLNKRVRELEGKGEEVRIGTIGIVQPGEGDGENVTPELVVIEQDRKEVGEPYMADGQRVSVEGEMDLVTGFVKEHPDLFPPNPRS